MIILEITEWVVEAFMLGWFMLGASIFVFFLTLAFFAIKDHKNK
tara:strand:+ start:34 stop:165 length:132 start_codon:yes stop_codon:yes gene_type:complete